ncbi:unnamed protein product [Allacma fusca]|uniref:C2H2-type domain-containing protein n=1 Tax=Allacma fusca TaxID=39272 RepID=A0A8J2JI56_9HEXA|nr:unnamed protein product [Allacma fusca]
MEPYVKTCSYLGCAFKTFSDWNLTCHVRKKHPDFANSKRSESRPGKNVRGQNIPVGEPKSIRKPALKNPKVKLIKTCPITNCGYKTHKKGFRRHMRIHSSKRNWKCDKCDYTAKERDKLERHRRIHLSSAEREILMKICPFPKCDFKSLHSASLNRHLLTHSTERPFKCDKCDYAAKMRNILLKHQRTHLTRSEKTFKVYPKQNCQFRTVSQQNVQAQLLLHQEGNILRCCPMQGCDFRTGRASNLRRHITAHSTERPFKCDKCEWAFKSGWQLKEHQHTHLSAEEREAFLEKCPMRSCNFRSFYRKQNQKKPFNSAKSQIVTTNVSKSLENY